MSHEWDVICINCTLLSFDLFKLSKSRVVSLWNYQASLTNQMSYDRAGIIRILSSEPFLCVAHSSSPFAQNPNVFVVIYVILRHMVWPFSVHSHVQIVLRLLIVPYHLLLPYRSSGTKSQTVVKSRTGVIFNFRFLAWHIKPQKRFPSYCRSFLGSCENNGREIFFSQFQITLYPCTQSERDVLYAPVMFEL